MKTKTKKLKTTSQLLTQPWIVIAGVFLVAVILTVIAKTVVPDTTSPSSASTSVPFIDSVTPNSGDYASTHQITVRGSGFGTNAQSAGMLMLSTLGAIGGLPAAQQPSLVSWSDTAIVATVPVFPYSRSATPYLLTVTVFKDTGAINFPANAVRKDNAYSVTYDNASSGGGTPGAGSGGAGLGSGGASGGGIAANPVITSVSPTTGSYSAAHPITIRGTGFGTNSTKRGYVALAMTGAASSLSPKLTTTSWADATIVATVPTNFIKQNITLDLWVVKDSSKALTLPSNKAVKGRAYSVTGFTPGMGQCDPGNGSLGNGVCVDLPPVGGSGTGSDVGNTSSPGGTGGNTTGSGLGDLGVGNTLYNDLGNTYMPADTFNSLNGFDGFSNLNSIYGNSLDNSINTVPDNTDDTDVLAPTSTPVVPAPLFSPQVLWLLLANDLGLIFIFWGILALGRRLRRPASPAVVSLPAPVAPPVATVAPAKI